MTATCEAIWSFLGIEAECGEPAVGQFRRICVHEHIRDGWLCQEHGDPSERGVCGTCCTLDDDLAHDCSILVVPLEPEPQQGGAV